MAPTRFTVSQVRVAAACPRILYFDAVRSRETAQPVVTRIWKSAVMDEGTALGSLFHDAIERFNGTAASHPAILEQLTQAAQAATKDDLANALRAHVYQECVDRGTLFKSTGLQQQNFMAALQRYVSELADVLIHARNAGRSWPELLEELFGDGRRRVEVTMAVGPAGEAVRVAGILDYFFYDWRTAHHRIVDYKLAPADTPGKDLFQVSVYALMHHQQHGTTPDVGVLYLHPERRMYEKSWDQVHNDRPATLNLLASMREWVEYDEVSRRGLKPPGEPLYCAACRWRNECETRLGPKHEGERLNHWRRGVETPSPQTIVTPDAVPGSNGTQAASPVDGTLTVGRELNGQRTVEIPCRALPMHVAVVGAAGSGKTWLAKVIAEEVLLQGIPVLAIDPQGDLVQLCAPRPVDGMTASEQPGRDRYERLLEPRIFTPGSSHGRRLSLNPIRMPSADELTSIDDPQRRAEELTNVLTTLAGNLVRVARAGGDVDCQRTFVFQVLRHLTRLEGNRSCGLREVAAAVAAPDSIGLDDPDSLLRKAEREKLARKLNTLLLGPSANLFTGGVALDLNEFVAPTRPGRVPLNVVYLNALADDDQKQFLVAALAAEVYRWMITTGSASSGPRLLFYLDEAKDYLPAGNKKPPSKEPLLRLFAQGRKYGVACLFCTQSPRSVDYNAFTNCSTKVIGRLESAQDVERVAEWFARDGTAPGWLTQRKGAEAGTFVARWPDQDRTLDGRAWKSRGLFSLHEGAWSPERVEEELSRRQLRG